MPLDITPGGASSDSYASIETINAYAVKVGASFPITGSDGPSTAAAIAAAEAAARRATAAIDGSYGARFIGEPASAQQALEWPRKDAWYRGEELPDDTIPQKVVEAVAEAAIRELKKPGSMSPDLKRGGKIKAVGAGSARVEFADGAPATTVFQAIDGKLRGLVRSVARGVTFGRAVRA